jgi:hypothetical protein
MPYGRSKWICTAILVLATACKSSGTSAERGAEAAAARAPAPVESGGAPLEEPEPPTCECPSSFAAPPDPAAGWRAGGGVTPVTAAPLQPTPVVPRPASEPLAPGLAAHLASLPDEADLTVVVQADLRALIAPDQLRAALGQVAGMLADDDADGNPACLVELAAATDLATCAFFESRGRSESVVVILEGGADLAGVLECASRLVPSEFPPSLTSQAARGFVAIDGDDLAAATLGPRTLALGTTELVSRMRAGAVRNTLDDSRDFEAARRAAGPGPVYVAAFSRGNRDESFTGGAALRLAPRLGLSGSFDFGRLETAAEVIDEAAEAIAELDEERDEFLRQLAEIPAGADRLGEVAPLLDALTGLRLTLQGRNVSFEVWLPEGTTPDGLIGTAARTMPLLLLRGGGDSASAPAHLPPPPAEVESARPSNDDR